MCPHDYQAARFEAEGRAAAMSQANPYTPGTMAAGRWDEGRYQAFQAESQRRQAAYIVEERERMEKAAALCGEYHRAMREIGLHPLNRGEIQDRQRQLDGMAATIEETHGDNPGMRAAYRMHTDNEAA
jgi:hypothetical protein